MKIIIVICDNLKQYKDYMQKIAFETSPWTSLNIEFNMSKYIIGDATYFPIYNKEDIRKMLGFKEENIEIRIIGEKSILTCTTLKVHPHVFGLVM